MSHFPAFSVWVFREFLLILARLLNSGIGDGVPQPLHRDAGFVPASANFAAVLNVFFLLDDFTAENGGTHLVPGSHRWPEEHSIKPPARGTISELSAPAGSIFAFDGRIFHGTGLIQPGAIPEGVVGRRHLGYNFCLPWVRQQENWGVSLLNEVLEEASPLVQERLGMLIYGTLGQNSGAISQEVRFPPLFL